LVIMGLDAWLFTVLTDKEGTRRMLDITIPFFVRLCDALFADGADAIAMPMAFFARDITTDHLVSQFALPVLREALSQVKGPVVFHHTGSSFFDYLDLIDGLPRTLGLTLDVRDPLPEARSLIRKDTFLFAGLDGPSLHTLTADGIRTQCLEQLAERKNDGKFIPFATGTDVDMRTPLDNLLAIKAAVEEFKNG